MTIQYGTVLRTELQLTNGMKMRRYTVQLELLSYDTVHWEIQVQQHIPIMWCS